MIFSTFYFSGTGNTKWAVEQFNNIITKSGHQAQLFSIDINEKMTDAVLKDIIEDSDFIGFANPIYGGNIPSIMKTFIRRLIDIQKNTKVKKTTYFINTFGYVNGFGPIATKKLFANTCFNLTAYVNIRLFNNISTPKLKSDKISKATLTKRKAHANKELLLLSERLSSGGKLIKGIGPYLIPGMIIRKILRKAIAENYKSLSVNTQTCSRCMRCINHCPTHSIKIKDDNFCFSSGCTACMRCYNFCPTSSIVIEEIFADPHQYHRYTGPDSEW